MSSPSNPSPAVQDALSPSDAAESSNAAAAAAFAAGKLARTKKRLDVNPDLILAEGRNKRRRSPTPEEQAEEVKPQMESEPVLSEEEVLARRTKARSDGDSMIKSIKAFKDKEGRALSLMFIHLPDPKTYQDYYVQIKHPKSISQIEARLKLTPKSLNDSPLKGGKKGRAGADKGKEGEYEGYNDLAEVKHDLDVVFNNCKRYNVKEALIFQDARKLHKLAKDLYTSFTVERESSPEIEVELEPEPEPEPEAEEEAAIEDGVRPKKKRKVDGEDGAGGDSGVEGKAKGKEKGKTVYKEIKGAMKRLDTYVGPDGNRPADFFDDLPSRKDWADYYKLIAQPISLTEINAKLKERKYTSLDLWESDIKLMCANAKQYNIEDSAVYMDAVVLENALAEIMADLAPRPGLPAIHSPVTNNAIPKIKLNLGRKATSPLPSAPAATSSVPADPVDDSAMNIESEPSVPMPARVATPQPPVRLPSPPPPPVIEAPRPPLPVNAVTAYIIRSLHRYTNEEKQAWVATMDQATVHEMRRLMQGTEAQGTLPLAVAPRSVVTPIVVPSTPQPRPVADATTPVSVTAQSPARPPAIDPATLPKRPLPALPLIRFFSFTYDVVGGAAGSTIKKKTVKLRNSRGVVSHSIAVKQGTRQLEVSSYLEEGFFNLKPVRAPETEGNKIDTKAGEPAITASIGYAPLCECDMTANGHHVAGGLLYPDDDIAERPIGNRWTIPFPPGRSNLVLEVSVHRPAEAVKGLPGNRDVAVRETCMIFVARQT